MRGDATAYGDLSPHKTNYERKRQYDRERLARWRREHPEEVAEYNRQRREKNAENQRAYRERWRKGSELDVQHTEEWQAEEARILALPLEERLDILGQKVYDTCGVRLNLPTIPLEDV